MREPYLDTSNNKPYAAVAAQQGFSLIELMVVLAIVALMASIAVPSFTRMIRSQKVVGASSAVMTAFSVARTEAIKRGTAVTICATDAPNAAIPACSGATNWEKGWFIFTGAAEADLSAASLLQVGMGMDGVQIVAASSSVSYDKRGIPTIGAAIDVQVDAVPCTATVDKQIVVTLNVAGHLGSVAGTSQSGDCP